MQRKTQFDNAQVGREMGAPCAEQIAEHLADFARQLL
jgi:hypothetical protein